MLSLVGILIARVFSFILLGALLQRFARERGERAAAAVIWFALYALIPLFMLLSLWSSPLSPAHSRGIAAAALLVTGAGAAFALAWSRIRRVPYGVQALPLIFMNSAYLAIPVNTLLWGAAGTTYTILYNAVITVMTFTFGVWCVSKERPFAEIASLPVLYATAGGILLNIFWAPVPAFAAAAGKAVSLVTLPVMLIFVGYRLGRVSAQAFRPALAAALVRMGGGYLAGLCAVFLFGLSGPAAGVCVMTSSMPAAVFACILSERFGGDTGFAAAAVFLGTALTLLTVPALGYFYAR